MATRSVFHHKTENTGQAECSRYRLLAKQQTIFHLSGVVKTLIYRYCIQPTPNHIEPENAGAIGQAAGTPGVQEYHVISSELLNSPAQPSLRIKAGKHSTGASREGTTSLN